MLKIYHVNYLKRAYTFYFFSSFNKCLSAYIIPLTQTKSEKQSDLGDCAASFVAQMYASSNVTLSDVTRSVNCTKE